MLSQQLGCVAPLFKFGHFGRKDGEDVLFLDGVVG